MYLPIQNESYWQSPEKTKSNGEYEKKDKLSLLSLFTNAIDSYTWSKKIYLQGLLVKHFDMSKNPNI